MFGCPEKFLSAVPLPKYFPVMLSVGHSRASGSTAFELCYEEEGILCQAVTRVQELPGCSTVPAQQTFPPGICHHGTVPLYQS